MYIKKTLQTYLDDLAAGKPSPGGGSAAAACAACAASLVLMVVEFTPRNKKISSLLKEAGKIKTALSRLVDTDVMEYNKVALAYKKPAGSAFQRAVRKKAASRALRSALKVSEDICLFCFKGAKINKDLAGICNPNLMTDVAISLLLFEAAYKSAFYNVKVNLKHLKSCKLSEAKLKKYKKIQDELEAVKRETLKKVDKTL